MKGERHAVAEPTRDDRTAFFDVSGAREVNLQNGAAGVLRALGLVAGRCETSVDFAVVAVRPDVHVELEWVLWIESNVVQRMACIGATAQILRHDREPRLRSARIGGIETEHVRRCGYIGEIVRADGHSARLVDCGEQLAFGERFVGVALQ